MNYTQAIAFLQSFPDSERGLPENKPVRHFKMPLSTMLSLLKTLGNPQNKTKTIHITGSKGKGSTATFIASILNKAGFKTALFSSPHLHSYTERIAFDLKPVSEDIFAQGIAELKPYIEDFDKQGHTISTFGILTALFFHLVNKSSPPVDWQIVEVGLGGKDDATNVFSHKEAAVITPISLEHTTILGTTREAIAENKAGIITPGCLTVLAPQKDKKVVEIVKKICAEKNSQLVEPDDSSPFKLPTNIKMLGAHQKTNALTARALAHALSNKGFEISQDAITMGLISAFLPGRFEIIDPAASKNACDIDAPIILDGAHNGDSASALAKTLIETFSDRSILFILGINQDKNLEDIFSVLKHNQSSKDKPLTIIATRSDNYRAMLPEEIEKRIKACDPKALIFCTKNIEQALEKAKKYLLDHSKGPNQAAICVCGSLYLVAEAREKLLSVSNQPSFRL